MSPRHRAGEQPPDAPDPPPGPDRTEPTSPSDHLADPPPPAGVPAARASRPSVTTKIVVALLCAVLGFGVALQVRRTAAGDTLATVRPDDLVQILDGLQKREDELRAEIRDLTETLDRLRSAGASSAAALEEAQRRAEALGILTGTVPAQGQGVRITISDPTGSVPPEVLLDVVQELRNAGAEAFSVGPVRIGMDSAFDGAAGAVSVDGTLLESPYVIEAIGDPPTLSAALAIPGGVVDTVRRAGGTIDVEQVDDLTIEVLRPARAPLYARPAG